MIKAVANKNVALFPTTESGEVIKINDNTALVQGTGEVPFVILKDGKAKTVTIDFAEKPVQEVVI